MTPDEERWAEALMIERQHGVGAREHVAERLTQLALAGDDAGVARWLKIATRLDALDQRPQRSS